MASATKAAKKIRYKLRNNIVLDLEEQRNIEMRFGRVKQGRFMAFWREEIGVGTKEAGARRYTGLQIRLPRLKGPETHSLLGLSESFCMYMSKKERGSGRDYVIT